MNHPERKQARRFDTPGRNHIFTDLVYSGVHESAEAVWQKMRESEEAFRPEPLDYQILVGDLHMHSNFSDAIPEASPEAVLTAARDEAKLDFCALTDHDHGGVAKEENFGAKWERLCAIRDAFNDPGHFTVLHGYERDSYPWYANLVLWFRGAGEPIRGVRDGEVTKDELAAILAREDVLAAPHDTVQISPGCDFLSIPLELMTPLMELVSRGDVAEYFGNPYIEGTCVEGGCWRDALERGARIGVMGCSDDHGCKPGITLPERGFPAMYPGLTGVLVRENTREAIFDALKARRCYAFMGGRVKLDFRVNGAVMGSEITDTEEGTRSIWFAAEADAPVEKAELIKNGRTVILWKDTDKDLLFDYKPERETDYYYIRVTLKDGRMAWSSPVWVTAKGE